MADKRKAQIVVWLPGGEIRWVSAGQKQETGVTLAHGHDRLMYIINLHSIPLNISR
jgi:hypothetical protein